MSDILARFTHVFEPGSDPALPPLLLLHGTGGSEHDLIGLARLAAPGAARLGVRGQVREGPANRWFRRFGEGRFDLEDLERRAAELAEFVQAAREHYGFARPPLAVGYSNGANIAGGGLLMRHPEVLSGAVLMRVMAGLAPKPGLDLSGKPVLALSGACDPLAPADSRRRLLDLLRAAGAEVEERITGEGHGLGDADVRELTAFVAARRA